MYCMTKNGVIYRSYRLIGCFTHLMLLTSFNSLPSLLSCFIMFRKCGKRKPQYVVNKPDVVEIPTLISDSLS